MAAHDSQLDQLAREVQAIRQTVDSRNSQPPSSVTAVAIQSESSTAVSERNSRRGDTGVVVGDAQADPMAVPSLPRALNSQPFTGPDIDGHFSMYFRHFHPHFPILSEHDPNKCYDKSPFLFWVIILISCRRRPTNSSLSIIRLLTEHIKHETDAAIPKVPQPLTQLHAIILVAAWGLYPGVRFINDPAYWLSGIAINSCLLLGFHTGSGRHHDYSHASLAAVSSNKEAAVTWAASSILNLRLSHNLGLPCITPMNKATVNMIHDHGSVLPISLQVQLECQVYIERVNRMLGSSLEESNGVPSELVCMLEDEWAAARARIITRHTDPVLSLHTLFVLLEVQMYYFLPIPTQNRQSYTTASSQSSQENLSASIEAGILGCYTTASAIITKAVDLDEMSNLLHYLPHYNIRPLAHAITVIFRVIRSDLPLRHPQIVVPEEAAKISAHTITVSRRVAAVEGDLAWRHARCVELWHATSAPYLAVAATTAATASNAATSHDNESNNDSNHAVSTTTGLDYEPLVVDMFRQRMVASLGLDFMIRWKSKHGPVNLGPYGPQPQTQNVGVQVGMGETSGHMLYQQETSVQENTTGASMPPGETGLSLPSVEMMDTDLLLGTEWGFLDDFGWGLDTQAP